MAVGGGPARYGARRHAGPGLAAASRQRGHCLCATGGGPEQFGAGLPPVPRLRPATARRLFAHRPAPDPPPGTSLASCRRVTCSGREADPRRGGLRARPASRRSPPPGPGCRAASRPAPGPGSPSNRSSCSESRRRSPRRAPGRRDAGRSAHDFRCSARAERFDGPRADRRDPAAGGDWMRVRPDGIGVCAINALIRPDDGGVVLTEYSGLVDFGPDGYAALAAAAAPGARPCASRRAT